MLNIKCTCGEIEQVYFETKPVEHKGKVYVTIQCGSCGKVGELNHFTLLETDDQSELSSLIEKRG